VKSTEVYSIIRQVLTPWCKQHGFRRTKGGMLGWYKPIGNQFIVLWFQVSQDGWDEYAGSKFVVEFQISDEPLIGAAHNQRWRLPKFLNDDDLDCVRRMQNDVIVKLEKPDSNYYVLQLGDDVVNWYLAKFNPIVERYSRTDDIWLRYKEKEDVECWAGFVKEVLPKIVGLLSDATAYNSFNASGD
jgi:hypothetical protein